MANYIYRIYALVDPREPDRPRYLGAGRVDRTDWLPLWQGRRQLGNDLGAWFLALESAGLAPQERTLLGAGVGLDEDTARKVLRDWIAAAGGPSLLNERPATGGRGRRRPVLMIEANGSYTIYPSVTQAAEAVGIARQSIRARVRRGRPDSQGRSWV
jgi:hypothetical protein